MDDLTMLENAFHKLVRGDPSLIRRWITPQTRYQGGKTGRDLRGSRKILEAFQGPHTGLLKVPVVGVRARNMMKSSVLRANADRGFVVVLNRGSRNDPIVYDLWFDRRGKLIRVQCTLG